MSKKATVMAVVNQKGGTGKTTTCENLGVGLAMEGKKVLVVDGKTLNAESIWCKNITSFSIVPVLVSMMVPIFVLVV